MQFKKYFFVISYALLLSSCVEVDLLSIEVKEDLSSNVNFVVSPPGTERTWGQQTKDSFSKHVNSAFEKCGFKTQSNLKYDTEGISANQVFSSVSELDQSINCLINTSDKDAPFRISVPAKSDNLIETTYKLKIDVRNPDLIFDKGGSVPKRIQVFLPGKMLDSNIENQVSTLKIRNSEATYQSIAFEINPAKLLDSEDYLYKTTGIKLSDISPQNDEGLKEAFQKKTGLDPDNWKANRKFFEGRIPAYSTITVNSKKSKISIELLVAFGIGLLTAVVTLIPVFISKK
jgi:hypothetical protein